MKGNEEVGDDNHDSVLYSCSFGMLFSAGSSNAGYKDGVTILVIDIVLEIGVPSISCDVWRVRRAMWNCPFYVGWW